MHMPLFGGSLHRSAYCAVRCFSSLLMMGIYDKYPYPL